MKKLFADTGILTILQAHHCVHKDINKWPGDALHSVFASSNYSPADANKCRPKPNLRIETFSLPPGSPLPRKQAVFKEMSADTRPKNQSPRARRFRPDRRS
jgi:hypothetical protein